MGTEMPSSGDIATRVVAVLRFLDTAGKTLLGAWRGLLRSAELLTAGIERTFIFLAGIFLALTKCAMGLFGVWFSLWLMFQASTYLNGWLGTAAVFMAGTAAVFSLYRAYAGLFVEHWPAHRNGLFAGAGTVAKAIAIWIVAQSVRHYVLMSYKVRRIMAERRQTRLTQTA